MTSFHLFFNKNANWDGDEKFVDSNSYDIGLWLEYDISEWFTLRAGWLRAVVGGLYVANDEGAPSLTIQENRLPFSESSKREAYGFSVGIEFGF